MPNVDEVLHATGFLAAQADQIGAGNLAADLKQVIAKHADGDVTIDNAPVALVETPSAQPQAPIVTTPGQLLADITAALRSGSITAADVSGVIDDVIEQPAAVPTEDEILERLEENVNEAIFADVRPNTVIFTVVSEQNLDVTEDEAREAALVAAAQLGVAARSGGVEQNVAFVFESAEQVDGIWQITLAVDENVEDNYAYSAMYSVNGLVLPLPHRDDVAGSWLSVTGVVGPYRDTDAARELGLLRDHLDGDDTDEDDEDDDPEAYGDYEDYDLDGDVDWTPRQRVEMKVTYRRVDGTELTDADVAAIVAHPMSQRGLATLNLGGRTADRIDASDDVNVKTAVFALEGVDTNVREYAANYVGEVNLGGTLGTIHAQGSYTWDDEIPAEVINALDL